MHWKLGSNLISVGWKFSPPTTAVRLGEVVAVKARTFGMWSLSAARIVYIVDEPRRFGFAYATSSYERLEQSYA